jgi:Tfp pilus assembly PilM family ATPase
MWNFLTAPPIPRTSLAVSETHLSLVTLRQRGRTFEPRNLGVLRLPDKLVRAHFTEPNIADEATFIDQLTKAATQANIGRVRRLTLALPEGSARSLVISLDSVPTSRAELNQMLDWKIERSLGGKSGEMRVTHKRLSPLNGRAQWLITAAHQQVLAQYERALGQIGWQAGVIVPQHLGEAQWLMRAGVTEDQALVSFNERGFAVVIVRGDEPIMVREIICAPEEREDEFHRLMVFYRDRLLPGNSPVTLNRLLTIGSSEEQKRFRNALEAALETRPQALTPQHLGLNLDPNAPFDRFAAAAGLATLGWHN